MLGNVISLAARRVCITDADQVDIKQRAVARLKKQVAAGSIVYVVLRYFNSDNDWLICDFYLIDGHDVGAITEDVAVALDRHDPRREVGMKLTRKPGADPLRDLIEGEMSKLLFGRRDAIRHQVIR